MLRFILRYLTAGRVRRQAPVSAFYDELELEFVDRRHGVEK